MGIVFDVIGDLPDKIKAKVPGREGKQIFMNGYNLAYKNGASTDVSFARGWAALAEAGYVADDQGQWVPLTDLQEESLFERVLARFHINAVPSAAAFKKLQDEMLQSEEFDFELTAEITKLDEDQRLVYGWASIVEEDGKIIFDKQDDMIETQELVNAAHDFMTESREAHEMHKGKAKGVVVESMVFTKEVQKALGIDLKKVGWFIVQKIYDDKTWEKFKSGELKSFSIGGRGKRTLV